MVRYDLSPHVLTWQLSVNKIGWRFSTKVVHFFQNCHLHKSFKTLIIIVNILIQNFETVALCIFPPTLPTCQSPKFRETCHKYLTAKTSPKYRLKNLEEERTSLTKILLVLEEQCPQQCNKLDNDYGGNDEQFRCT